MREIKFRQAIFKDGKFHHWHYWGFCGYRGDFVAPIRIKPMGDAIDPTGYEVKESQQYPELNDKNGKEIYEGDILSIEKWFNYIKKWVPYAHEVIFRTGGFLAKRLHYEDYQSLTFLPNHIEVIGNIYENPELLEEV